jgi:hypothetical protein
MEVDATSFPFSHLSPTLLFLRLVYLFVSTCAQLTYVIEVQGLPKAPLYRVICRPNLMHVCDVRDLGIGCLTRA